MSGIYDGPNCWRCGLPKDEAHKHIPEVVCEHCNSVLEESQDICPNAKAIKPLTAEDLHKVSSEGIITLRGDERRAKMEFDDVVETAKSLKGGVYLKYLGAHIPEVKWKIDKIIAFIEKREGK